MEVHYLPVASEPPQHERAPLARRFAAEVKRDDSDSTGEQHGDTHLSLA